MQRKPVDLAAAKALRCAGSGWTADHFARGEQIPQAPMLGQKLLGAKEHGSFNRRRAALLFDQRNSFMQVGKSSRAGSDVEAGRGGIKHGADGTPVQRHGEGGTQRTAAPFGLAQHVDGMSLS